MPTEPTRTLTLAQAQVALCEGDFTATKFADPDVLAGPDTRLRDLVDFNDEAPATGDDAS